MTSVNIYIYIYAMFIPSIIILFSKYFNKPIVELDLPCSTLQSPYLQNIEMIGD